MAYIKGTFEQCKDYDALVTAGENYSYPTDNWANPIEINGDWYVLKHEDYDSDLELVNELPEITPPPHEDNP